MRDILGRIEVTVTWGIEWEVGVRCSTVILAISHSTKAPESPARCCWCAWDISCVGLEEVDLVQWSGVV